MVEESKILGLIEKYNKDKKSSVAYISFYNDKKESAERIMAVLVSQIYSKVVLDLKELLR